MAATRELKPHWTEQAVCGRMGGKKWDALYPEQQQRVCRTRCSVMAECDAEGKEQPKWNGLVWGGKHYPAGKERAPEHALNAAIAKRDKKLALVRESRAAGDDWEATRRKYGARFTALLKFLERYEPTLIDAPLRRLVRLEQTSWQRSHREAS